jgi:hypothetical protein
MANTLKPEYVSLDFNTIISNIKTELSKSDTFRDYDYEGSNITILMELMAYIGELNTYFLNKIAKNVYIDTADQYENVHRLATLIGYDPKGYISAQTTLSITVFADTCDSGDHLTIGGWHQISTDETDEDGNIIKYATTASHVELIPLDTTFPYTFTVPVRQGVVITYDYTGRDIINNEIILPINLNYAYDNVLEDEYESILLTVDDEPWSRVSDFYDEISGLCDETNVYKFEYDKYQRYKIVFNTSRGLPTENQEIQIKLLETLAEDGSVGIGKIITPDNDFIYNNMKDRYLSNSEFSVTNLSETTSSAERENILTIKSNAKSALHAQFRNVTASDYISYLESRSDVNVANVWGEKEIAPSGDTSEYNKVHICVIPNEWGSGTIETVTTSAGYNVPTVYSSIYESNLKDYLEPRKMLTTYEKFELPDLVYFVFDIGIRINRNYSFADIVEDVRNKLEYYFTNGEREFNETLSFLNIEEFLLDSTNVSDDDNFENITGIRNLVIRDIDIVTHTIYDYDSSLYPRYLVDIYTGDNNLREIKLGYNQYPVILIDNCTFTQET